MDMMQHTKFQELDHGFDFYAPQVVQHEGRHILLGVTGGVAAFKAAELARELQRRGATVQVAMTEAGTRFVTAATFQALTGRPVFTDQWDARPDNNANPVNAGNGPFAIPGTKAAPAVVENEIALLVSQAAAPTLGPNHIANCPPTPNPEPMMNWNPLPHVRT